MVKVKQSLAERNLTAFWQMLGVFVIKIDEIEVTYLQG